MCRQRCDFLSGEAVSRCWCDTGSCCLQKPDTGWGQWSGCHLAGVAPALRAWVPVSDGGEDSSPLLVVTMLASARMICHPHHLTIVQMRKWRLRKVKQDHKGSKWPSQLLNLDLSDWKPLLSPPDVIPLVRQCLVKSYKMLTVFLTRSVVETFKLRHTCPSDPQILKLASLGL